MSRAVDLRGERHCAAMKVIGFVDALISMQLLAPRDLVRAQSLIREYDQANDAFWSAQDNISEPDLDASLEGVQAAMTEDAR